MLRSLGIPARLTTGFLSNEWNDRGHYFVVRMKDAHAWVEAYLPPAGWVEFDPSPREARDATEFSKRFRKWSEIADHLNLQWNRTILSYDFQRQVDLVRSVTDKSNQLSSQMDRWTRFYQWRWNLKNLWDEARGRGGLKSVPKIGWNLLVVATPFMVIPLLIFSRRWWKRHKDPVWFYREFVRKLEKRAGRKKDSQTLKEFILNANAHWQKHEAEIALLEESYHRLRFDPAAHITPAQTRLISTTLHRLK